MTQLTCDRNVRDFGGRGQVRYACRHHRQAVVAVPVQRGHQVRDGRRVAGRDHPPRAVTPAAAAMQSLAEHVPCKKVQCRDGRQDHGQVSTGQIQPRCVRRDGHPGGQARRRVEHLAELIGSETDEPRVITAGERQAAPPQDGDHSGKGQVGNGQITLTDEADLDRQRAGHQGADAVRDNEPPDVRAHPGGGARAAQEHRIGLAPRIRVNPHRISVNYRVPSHCYIPADYYISAHQRISGSRRIGRNPVRGDLPGGDKLTFHAPPPPHARSTRPHRPR